MDESVYPSCDFIAGWTAGIAGLIIGHPLDTIKVRQQTFKNAKGFDILRKTWQFEGVIGLKISGCNLLSIIIPLTKMKRIETCMHEIYGFYKGVGFPLLTAGALNSLFFGIYGSILRSIEKNYNPSNPEEHGHKYIPYSYVNICLAGSISGMVSCIISTPVDLIKIQLQAQTGIWEQNRRLKHMSPADLFMKYYKRYGVKGLYHGGLMMVYRESISFAIYVCTYAEMMTRLPGEATVSSVMIAGGVAGMMSWALVMPLDVIKTRLQSDDLSAPEYKGIIDCATKTYKKDGLTAFQRGFFMCCLRSFPVNAATFVAYEWCVKLCTNLIDTHF